MRKFKSVKQAQRFLGAHAAVYNLFNLGRHLVSAENYRYFRLRACVPACLRACVPLWLGKVQLSRRIGFIGIFADLEG
jgi:hypothetical protein